MARTMQTARRSTGGKAPKKQLATEAARKSELGAMENSATLEVANKGENENSRKRKASDSQVSPVADKRESPDSSKGAKDAEEARTWLQNEVIAMGIVTATVAQAALNSFAARMDGPVCEIGGLPWYLSLQVKTDSDTKNWFIPHIYCNVTSESTLWKCKATMEFRLLTSEPNKPLSKKSTFEFTHSKTGVYFSKFISFDELQDAANGFFKDGRCIVEAVITIQEATGVRSHPAFDFTNAQSGLHDATLIIDGTSVYVSKLSLATYSPVFRAMFFSDFQESRETQIPLHDVVLEEFLELLHVIYPCHRPISAKNVGFLLKLADRFEVLYVLDECEKYLSQSKDVSVAKKLLFADQYRLSKLQDECLKTFKRNSDIKVLKSSQEYAEYGEATIKALLERMIKLTA